jgi:aryl-alcohol dehydrogenase-like predicted oxidoreductase
MRHKSPCVVPIPGASKVESIEDSVKSLQVQLSESEMKKIDDLCEEISKKN